jgi:hypothetical protein
VNGVELGLGRGGCVYGGGNAEAGEIREVGRIEGQASSGGGDGGGGGGGGIAEVGKICEMGVTNGGGSVR